MSSNSNPNRSSNSNSAGNYTSNSNGTGTGNSNSNPNRTGNSNSSNRPIFDGRFYEIWAFEIKLHLSDEQLWPLDKLNEQDDLKALKLLYGSIAREVLAAIGSPSNSTDLWAKLKSRYGRDCSIQKQISITTGLMKKTLDSPDGLKTFLQEFRKQHEELIAAGGKMTDTEACAVLLNNLPQYYQPFAFGFQAVNQSNWSVDDLCNQLERLPLPPKANLSLISKTSSPPSPCPICQGDHWKSACTERIMTCFKCDQPGHKANKCPSKSNKKPSLYSLTSWIVDSGASNHMTGNMEELVDIESCNGPNMETSSGEVMATKGIGKASSFPMIGGVHYIPGLKFNLLSTSTLTQKEPLFLQFTKNL